MTGCGGTPAPVVKAVDTSLLAGNWQLTDSMPSGLFILGQQNPFRLAVNFDVSGNVISATGVVNDHCTNSSVPSGVSFGLLSTTGTIAPDGSFTVQTQGNLPASQMVTIQGSMPKTAGGPWSGTYSSALSSPLPGGCTESSSGSFTATPFALVNGTYAGAATGGGIISGQAGAPVVPPPTSIEITVQQGGDASIQVGSLRFPKISILTGSIRVQGSSCFASGTTDGTLLSNIEGNKIELVFAMDDGSMMRLSGSLTDATESQITAGLVLVTGGRCGASSPYTFVARVLDRKP
ncbi:hypothetical protein [Granulicella sp. dw_53]|uniref:hypothetical protein n=1 Tax=Granulicella sp. dw_53 TaxID=2719792 RepID=UPI001BD67079|nr:hypothetical protein [Granulicella sp. dw_53]